MRFFSRHKRIILFFVIGCQFGFLIDQIPNLQFEDKVSPMEVMNCFLTLILAIIIAYFIEPASVSRRIEKDILIDQLKSVKDTAKSINNLLVENYEVNPLTNEIKTNIIVLFKNLSNQLSEFFEEAVYCKNKIGSAKKQTLTNILFRYKRSVTGNHFQRHNYTFSNTQYQKYQQSFSQFIGEINHLIIDINKQ